MKTIFEHTQSRILVIPQALYTMKDIELLWQHGNSAIFHKSLKQDLRNIEFYTNIPCFIYIESGVEILTNNSHNTVTLTAGRSVFLPQGLNLHSDFVRETKDLTAKLVFFDDELITDYLKRIKIEISHKTHHQEYFLLEENGIFDTFFKSINLSINEDAYFNNKLQELLHLIAHTDKSDIFHSMLSTKKVLPPKKNLMRLLDTFDSINLSVSDLAHLSGRSLSSFNRDFKAMYQTSAKQWLLERRLSKAKELLESEKHSVTDVAIMVGYNNVSHFIKAFKDKYGMTPKAAIFNDLSEKR